MSFAHCLSSFREAEAKMKKIFFSKNIFAFHKYGGSVSVGEENFVLFFTFTSINGGSVVDEAKASSSASA